MMDAKTLAYDFDEEALGFGAPQAAAPPPRAAISLSAAGCRSIPPAAWSQKGTPSAPQASARYLSW